MNTPKSRKPKRFDLEAWRQEYWKDVHQRNGVFGLALANAEGAISFALMVTEFNHLESNMEEVAEVILAVERDTAAHVMRSIISARARTQLLRNVLERARQNSAMPGEFDEIIDEFEGINRARNDFVHAKYQTREATGEVRWIRPQDDPTLLRSAAYQPFDIEQLELLRERITDLSIKISCALAEHEQTSQP
ncbi:MAG: hypothetical protein R3D99_05110 [Altererythrobacter sp.]